MNISNCLFLFPLILFQLNKETLPIQLVENIYMDIEEIHDSIRSDFCNYFYIHDTLDNNIYFNFNGMDDFGPITLSTIELKEIYCEIKRGRLEAYKILCLHYFYKYPYCPPSNEIEKLICITDYLVSEYSYYQCCLNSADIIFSYLIYNIGDMQFVDKMLEYYDMFFEHSHSKSVAKKLYNIYCGEYWFHEKDLVKEQYFHKYCSTALN